MAFWNRKKKPEVLQVGDWGKCIDDRDWNGDSTDFKLVYGKKYQIKQVVRCPDCGGICYDIGAKFFDETIHTRCTIGVREHHLPCQGIHLAGAFRFEKSTEMTEEEKKEQIASLVKEEKYEEAHKLLQETKENK